jgi:hypothetical protein
MLYEFSSVAWDYDFYTIWMFIHLLHNMGLHYGKRIPKLAIYK